jgi:3-methyladenine DNA glycosylase AlkD
MIEAALAQLRAAGDLDNAAVMAEYHKAARVYFGVQNPKIDEFVKAWRAEFTYDERLSLASGLWDSDVHEARIAAAKLLTQARIKPEDSGAWALIASWVDGFDAWAIADHVCTAGAKRLVTDPSRLDQVEVWTTHPNMWARRAALLVTLPWTKQNHPSDADQIIRDRVLGWAAGYVDDKDRFIQKAIAWWLRELSKHDPERVLVFLDAFGAKLSKPALREAQVHLAKTIDFAARAQLAEDIAFEAGEQEADALQIDESLESDMSDI